MKSNLSIRKENRRERKGVERERKDGREIREEKKWRERWRGAGQDIEID